MSAATIVRTAVPMPADRFAPLDDMPMLVAKHDGLGIDADLHNLTYDEALGVLRHLRRRDVAEVAQRAAES